jgi:proline racemase
MGPGSVVQAASCHAGGEVGDEIVGAADLGFAVELAVLVAQGRLGVGDRPVMRSIIDSTFTGTVSATTSVRGLSTVSEPASVDPRQ